MFFGKLKVLVAEDSKLQRAMLVTILKARKEYTILEAEDGLEAQKLIEKKKPNMCILDVEMPGMKGHELCLWMKSNDKYAHIPVMIVTATTKNAKLSDEELCIRFKADDFITKPYQSADIYKRIDQLVKTYTGPEKGGTKMLQNKVRWRL
ncbi:MAG: response regulator [Planctomycetota bacterium]|jgi:CheY-like chemotaxis protein|nr:response regulator [Planctomycetota bacterium]